MFKACIFVGARLGAALAVAAILSASAAHQAHAQFVCDSDAAGESGESADATGSVNSFACGTFANASAAASFNSASGSGANASGDSSGNTTTGFTAIAEIRLGVVGTDLEPGGGGDGQAAINVELLTDHLGESENASIFERLLHPRLHLGATLNPDSGGVNQANAGLTWDYPLSNSLFVETSFGTALHDGGTSGSNSDSYGCTLQFRESLSLGVSFNEHLRVMATVDHMSNAGLCDENQGLTNAGVRLGYRW